MAELSDEVLNVLAEAERAASPGPWERYIDMYDLRIVSCLDDGTIGRTVHTEKAKLGEITQALADVALIALLRTHAPALIAAARRERVLREAATSYLRSQSVWSADCERLAMTLQALAATGEQGE